MVKEKICNSENGNELGLILLKLDNNFNKWKALKSKLQWQLPKETR